MAIRAPTVKLNNGKEMPVLGLGTFLLQQGGDDLVKAAVDVGYRAFDTAYIYHSEKSLGQAIRDKIAEGAIKREDVFITSKLWCTYGRPDLIVKACKASVKNLGLDYLDLFLMHWPYAFKAMNEPGDPIKEEFYDGMEIFNIKEYFPKDESGNIIMDDTDYVDAWKQMEKCVELGLTKSIGVSNYNAQQLKRLIENSTIKPVVNQVEYHPYLNQKKLREFCKENGVFITAFAPLGSPFPPNVPGIPRLIENPTILKIAQAHNKTPAQVALRYLVQMGIIVIPKTANPKRLKENISIFDFTLSPAEMSEVDSLDCNHRIYTIPGVPNHKYKPF